MKVTLASTVRDKTGKVIGQQIQEFNFGPDVDPRKPRTKEALDEYFEEHPIIFLCIVLIHLANKDDGKDKNPGKSMEVDLTPEQLQAVKKIMQGGVN